MLFTRFPRGRWLLLKHTDVGQHRFLGSFARYAQCSESTQRQLSLSGRDETYQWRALPSRRISCSRDTHEGAGILPIIERVNTIIGLFARYAFHTVYRQLISQVGTQCVRHPWLRGGGLSHLRRRPTGRRAPAPCAPRSRPLCCCRPRQTGPGPAQEPENRHFLFTKSEPRRGPVRRWYQQGKAQVFSIVTAFLVGDLPGALGWVAVSTHKSGFITVCEPQHVRVRCGRCETGQRNLILPRA